jgi:cytoskeletal protein CcmA (bactofilin family)
MALNNQTVNHGGIAVGTSERPNLKVFGSGNPPGGHYHKVKMMGDGDIFGDLECDKLRVLGTNHVDGNVKAGRLLIMGTSGIHGDLESNEARILGEMDIDGDAFLKVSHLLGNVEIKGSLSGEEAKIRGNLSVDGNCEMEIFRTRGVFTINGLLNAEHVKISLHYADSTAGEIGGEKVKVKRGAKFLKANRSIHLTAEAIEGDEIDLEYTKAKVVRGKNVRLGPGCEIDLVEYQGDFRKDKNAEVKENRKI